MSMGWGGDWQDPKERAAAQEAARRAEEERAIADARTQTVASAVRAGFADLAAAIVCAAGPEAIAAYGLFKPPTCLGVPFVDSAATDADPSRFNEASAQVDRDIDDLIDQQDQ